MRAKEINLLLGEAEEARVRNDCKLIDEPIRWREQAFHWPRIILSFFIIYGAIALGIYATYRAYRYVHSRVGRFPAILQSSERDLPHLLDSRYFLRGSE